MGNINNKCHYEYGNFEYQGLWHNRNIGSRIIYVMIPVIILGSFFVMLWGCGVFDSNSIDYGFFDDVTNSFVLSYLLFFIYFTSGKFLSYLGDEMMLYESDYIRNRIRLQSKTKNARIFIIKLSLIVAIICASFFIISAYNTDQLNPDKDYWYSKIGTAGMIFYGLIISYTWYKSIHFFLSIIVDLIVIYCWSSDKYGLKTQFVGYDYPQRYKKFKSCFLLCVFFGFYYLVAVVSVFFSDWRANHIFHINMFLSKKYGWLVAVATVIISVFYFSIIYISRYSFIKTAKTKLLFYEDEQQVFSIENININSVLVFITSTVIPIAVPLVQSILSKSN